MSRPSLFAILVALIASLGSCSSSPRTDSALPKRPAFPRIALYDTVYTVPSIDVPIALNAASEVQPQLQNDGSHWLTVNYPRYNALLYITLSPVESLGQASEIVDNRIERIGLNLLGAPAEISEGTTPANYNYSVVRSSSLSSTPLQFVAAPLSGRGWVVSGSVFFPSLSPDSPIDSISPVIDALAVDIDHAILSLR